MLPASRNNRHYLSREIPRIKQLRDVYDKRLRDLEARKDALDTPEPPQEQPAGEGEPPESKQ